MAQASKVSNGEGWGFNVASTKIGEAEVDVLLTGVGPAWRAKTCKSFRRDGSSGESRMFVFRRGWRGFAECAIGGRSSDADEFCSDRSETQANFGEIRV